MGDRLSRRLLVLRTVTLGGTATALTACVPPPPPVYYPQPVRGTGITDADPNDGPGNGRGGGYRRGTGITDADPNDGAGNGRGGGYRRGTGITDADPNDGAGNGRGGGYRRGTGITDADPNDGAGNGRGGNRGYRTGRSDADPYGRAGPRPLLAKRRFGEGPTTPEGPDARPRPIGIARDCAKLFRRIRRMDQGHMDQGLAEAAFALAFPGLAVDEVLALREGLDWRYFPAAGARRFDQLVSIAAIDAHLRTDGARSPRVSMGRRIPQRQRRRSGA